MKRTFQLLLSLTCGTIGLAAFAQEPGSAYIKNTGSDRVHIWINGSYQGYIKPGETRYTVSDGFISNDSDRPLPEGGHTATRESHGGWENDSKDSVTVTYQFPDGERKNFKVSVNERGEALAGVTNKEGLTPEVPSEEDRENAPAIIKGTMPNLRTTKKDENPTSRSILTATDLIATVWIRVGEPGSNLMFSPEGNVSMKQGDILAMGIFRISGNSISINLTRRERQQPPWN